MQVSKIQSKEHQAPGQSATTSGVWLACFLLFGAMFNLTLVVAGLKEFIIDELGGTVTDATLTGCTVRS